MNDRTRKQLKLFAVFWIIIGVLGIFKNGFVEPDLNGAVASALCLISFGLLFWFINKPRDALQEPEEFINELKEHKDEILSSGWEYRGMQITPKTVITQYFLTMSLLVFSAKAPSRYYIVGTENTTLVNAIYSFMTLILGWWGIPWGPIYTVQSLVTNLKGGLRINVADILINPVNTG